MKKKEKKKQQLKPRESSLRKRSKSTSAWPPQPKSCREGSIAEASGDYSQVVQHSSLFVQRYHTGEKMRKGNSWNVERLTQQHKMFLGFTVHVPKRCPDARSRSMICDRSRNAKLGRKITLSGFCLFFKPRLPQEDGVHLHWCPYRGITGTDFDSKR